MPLLLIRFAARQGQLVLFAASISFIITRSGGPIDPKIWVGALVQYDSHHFHYMESQPDAIWATMCRVGIRFEKTGHRLFKRSKTRV